MKSRIALLAGLALSTIALPAYAQRQINLQCMQGAVELYENALINYADAYNANVRNAAVNRKDVLKNAWTIADERTRKDAIRNADKYFKDSERLARNTRKSNEKSAKANFNDQKKLCVQ